jgi:hypothetical protein
MLPTINRQLVRSVPVQAAREPLQHRPSPRISAETTPAPTAQNLIAGFAIRPLNLRDILINRHGDESSDTPMGTPTPQIASRIPDRHEDTS